MLTFEHLWDSAWECVKIDWSEARSGKPKINQLWRLKKAATSASPFDNVDKACKIDPILTIWNFDEVMLLLKVSRYWANLLLMRLHSSYPGLNTLDTTLYMQAAVIHAISQSVVEVAVGTCLDAGRCITCLPCCPCLVDLYQFSGSFRSSSLSTCACQV